MPKRKTIAIDFDGVIADYSKGYQGQGVFGPIIPGASEYIRALKEKGWKIIIFTCRGEEGLLAKYLDANNIPYDDINKNDEMYPGTNKGKVFCDVLLDDRALKFEGNWKKSFEEILNFKGWQEEAYK